MRSHSAAPFCPVLELSYFGKKRDVTLSPQEGKAAQQDGEFCVSCIEHFDKNDLSFFFKEHLNDFGSSQGATGIWRRGSGKNNVSVVHLAVPEVPRSV